MKMKKISLIRVCLVIIAVALLINSFFILENILDSRISNHLQREKICLSQNLTYIESFQSHGEVVFCCSVIQYENSKYIEGCSEILVEDYK